MKKKKRRKEKTTPEPSKEALEEVEKRKEALAMAEIFGEDHSSRFVAPFSSTKFYSHNGKLYTNFSPSNFVSPDYYFEYMEKRIEELKQQNAYDDGYPK